ncbi:MAG TPA: flavin-dependent oxidoreductase [Stellaceae bacterium]|nr:flavin-dependent oxidoreductase [Stellaceae bacterium]
MMEVAIVGGGVAGLGLALNLHRRGIACRVFEAAPEVKELGVGITLLPHAMRELTALGLEHDIARVALETKESCFFNRFGQLIYREPRGRYGGNPYPEMSIHRGRLHLALYRAAVAQLGSACILTDRQCLGVAQDDTGVTLRLRETSSGREVAPVRADIAIACDGVNSTVRRGFYPDEQMAFAGINTWRGVTRRKPILTGRSYMRIGSIRTGKLVVYPIIDDVDGDGNQLVNWMAEIQISTATRNDWNKPGRLEDFLPYYRDWKFDWLDVPEMMATADLVLEYPMVDKDPVARWTFGRITLAGDAAHPMYPRGSNGAAQALIDVRTLADLLGRASDPVAALKEYEDKRLGPTSLVVRTNREHPPDFICIKVEELVGDRPFERLDDYISQDALRAMSEEYKRIAGYAAADLA